MAETRFDPSGYLTFDLARGRIAAPSGGGLVALPAEHLAKLAGDADSGALGRLGKSIGEWFAGRLRERLASAGDPTAVPPETFLSELNGLLAVHGFGRAAIESYGDAVLLRVGAAVLAGPEGVAFYEAFFAGLFGAFLDQTVHCLAIDTPESRTVLVGSPPAIRRAAQLRTAGVAPETIATRLHQESRAARKGAR